ncbi:uncharacterized protein A4U43_C05F25140 [Asparagus officinalis]|uniref:Anaphase-promoting complex subunit 4 n=1 Tax=Asparagus officinalis TaxID=4686 RepID=A0A5P1EUC1_ASPOF|nr:anaphase-promoting complex subunit 4 isoform X2 [Asparagus officinalis]ONK69635.1 uncharacterized protein A4U43_C05F25140 [Asparagus officinalis]
MAEDEIDAELEESTSTAIPFQLQFEKPIPSLIKIAEWNPEKDLLAMVTEESKVFLHRFNWQRLWMISPGKCVTSLCWRPDGKAIAIGLEDGLISLHDVENGKLLRSIKLHNVAVTCLNWVEDGELMKVDRTMRFFPPPPRIPRMPGLVSGDNGLMDDPEDLFQDLLDSSHQHFNILCSGDKDGFICFSIFGIFPIGKINIHTLKLFFQNRFLELSTYELANASIQKVAFSKNLRELVVVSFGELSEEICTEKDKRTDAHETARLAKSTFNNAPLVGLHCFLLDTSIFSSRKIELHKVAVQGSNIENLLEVVRTSLSVMSKHWSGAMNSFHDKFDSLATLIESHGLESSPQDEFLSLLFGARTSPPLHQFLVNSLGESGLKRVAKALDGAGKELHLIVREHLQPAVEIIGFRIGELRGLSRWRTQYDTVGLNEKLINDATEHAGIFMVQVERFLRVLAIMMYQFQNFFNWLSKCIRILLSEPTDQIQPVNSELVVIFLKFLFDHDPVGQLLEVYEVNHSIEVDIDTMQRVEELVAFGGFSDTKFLHRTLAKEFNLLEECFKEAFFMPSSTVSSKIRCKDFLPLFPSSPVSFSSLDVPISVFYYKGVNHAASSGHTPEHNLMDYICFTIPDKSLDRINCIGIVRGFTDDSSSASKVAHSVEVVFLCIPEGHDCIDLSLYKETQLVLLLNEASSSADGTGRSWMIMIQLSDLSFTLVSKPLFANLWRLHELKASATDLHLDSGKVRCVPHTVTKPLAVSASRGVACLFSSRRHALVYILDEDEEEASDTEGGQ